MLTLMDNSVEGPFYVTVIILEITLREDGSRWQNRTWNSPPSTNTSKIPLHVEQFSQNTC